MNKFNRGNTTLGLLVLVLISLVLTIVSFMMFDMSKVKALEELLNENFSIPASLFFVRKHKLVDEEKLQDINEIRVKNLDSVVTIKEGENKLQVYSHLRDLDKHLDYRVEDGILFLDSEGFYGFEGLAIGIRLKNPDDVRVVIEDLDGVLEVEERIKSLKIGSLDGVLDINSSGGFNVEIGSLDGVMDWHMEEENLDVSIESISGISDIFGDGGFDSVSSFNKIYGTGDYKLTIEELKGILSVE